MESGAHARLSDALADWERAYASFDRLSIAAPSIEVETAHGYTPSLDEIIEFVRSATKTLDGALQLDFDTVIPGHGPVTNKAGLQTYRDNVAKMRERVTQQIRGGKNQADGIAIEET